jgi:hypothetical protein
MEDPHTAKEKAMSVMVTATCVVNPMITCNIGIHGIYIYMLLLFSLSLLLYLSIMIFIILINNNKKIIITTIITYNLTT